MRSLLTHMHARIKRANRPNRRQPRHDKRPPRRPRGKVLDVAEDVRARVDGRVVVGFADRQCGGCCYDEADVEEDAKRLDFGHDFASEGGDDAVGEDGADVRAVDDGTGCGPVAVAGDGDH